MQQTPESRHQWHLEKEQRKSRAPLGVGFVVLAIVLAVMLGYSMNSYFSWVNKTVDDAMIEQPNAPQVQIEEPPTLPVVRPAPLNEVPEKLPLYPTPPR